MVHVPRTGGHTAHQRGQQKAQPPMGSGWLISAQCSAGKGVGRHGSLSPPTCCLLFALLVVSLTQRIPDLPARLAIVMGRELDGVSPTFLAASSRLVFLPMCGYTESFNVSVATALTLQRLFDICPAARGAMDDAERREVRRLWYGLLAGRDERRDVFEGWVEAGERGELRWSEEDLRPKEEGRVPRISRAQRRRVKEAGEREIIVAPGQAPQDRAAAASLASEAETRSQPAPVP